MSHPFQTASDVRKQFGGSSISCDLGVGCQETGICYAEAHGQPDKCGVTIVDGLDLSAIKPLTEAEADAHFSKPTISEAYYAALEELRGVGAGNEVLAIELYVRTLKERINRAYGQGRDEAWMRPGNGEMGG